MPELLKRNPQAKGKEEPEPIAEAKPLTMPKPTMADGTAIARFMLACLPRAKGQEVEARTPSMRGFRGGAMHRCRRSHL